MRLKYLPVFVEIFFNLLMINPAYVCVVARELFLQYFPTRVDIKYFFFYRDNFNIILAYFYSNNIATVHNDIDFFMIDVDADDLPHR